MKLRERLQQLKDEAERALVAVRPAPLAQPGPEPPVVARMVVEIRSDGTRTIARGAIEDLATQQKVALQAEGSTPLALALSLAGSLRQLPGVAWDLARATRRGQLPPASPGAPARDPLASRAENGKAGSDDGAPPRDH